jgi:TPR repeat protein
MERKRRLPPSRERNVESFDEDASVIEFMSYRSAPPPVSKGGVRPEDAMPLFLSDSEEAEEEDEEEPPRRPSFGRIQNHRDDEPPRLLKASIAPRLIKIGIFAVSAAAIIAAILSVQNPLDLFANAKASLTTPSGGQPAAIPSATAQLKPASEPIVALRTANADPAAPDIQTNLGARGLSPSAKGGPTRDEIASAFRTARQDQPEVRLPPAAVAPPAAAPPAAAPPATVAALPPATAFPPPTADLPAAAAPAARRLAPDELATLLKRAKSLIAIGDFAPARLLLKRAADAQEAGAALLLAQTYDPAVLGKQDMRSITPDPAKAREWYQKAAEFGSVEAQQRLSQMQN